MLENDVKELIEKYEARKTSCEEMKIISPVKPALSMAYAEIISDLKLILKNNKTLHGCSTKKLVTASRPENNSFFHLLTDKRLRLNIHGEDV